MKRPDWYSGGQSVPPLLLLLLSSLVLSGVLAYQAQNAIRSHREASESTLRDYAAFASWEFERELSAELRSLVGEVWDAAEAAAPDRDDESVSIREFREELRDETDDCRCPAAFGGYFVLDLRDGSLETLSGSLAPAVRQWITDSLSLAASKAPALGNLSRSFGDRNRFGNRFTGPAVWVEPEIAGDPRSTIIFAGGLDRDGLMREAFGFVLDLPIYAGSEASEIVEDSPLLPPSLASGVSSTDFLSIQLAGLDGEPFFDSGGFEPGTGVLDTLQTALGPLVLGIAVRPEVADRLVIGGLPRSRLPLLLGLFALTLGLFVVAVIQLRREQQLIRLRSRFVASVSHELRTPLAQIRLFSELLGSKRLSEDQRGRSVRIIHQEAQRLAYLVENVLRFSRSEQQPDRIAPQPLELGELVQEIVSGFEPLAEAQGSTLATILGDEDVALVDRDAVRQIVLNLLDNAVKYGRRGQTVTVGVQREGSRVRLWVDDEGQGVPVEDRARIWEPYRRLERDVELATGGSGIGLAVVRDLVSLHKGQVAVESSASGGARFVAWFPAASLPVEAPQAPRLEVTRGRGA